MASRGRGKLITSSGASTVQIAIRLPAEAIERAENIRGKSRLTVTRATVLREAVMRGLAELEREFK